MVVNHVIPINFKQNMWFVYEVFKYFVGYGAYGVYVK